MNLYQHYCKPSLASALISLGLDQSFHRAEGQYLYYYDEQQQEKAVLDFLGGYGAVILGHNHPTLVNTLTEQLKNQVAFHNQFSIRQGAAKLAAKLNPILQKETGWQEKFLCAFASTGAESVEVAVKHAEMNRGRQLDVMQEQLAQGFDGITEPNDPWDISAETVQFLPTLASANHEQKIQLIQQWNEQQLNQPPIFLALQFAFHGKLTTTIQMTFGEMYRYPFRRMGLNTKFLSPSELTTETLNQLLVDHQAFGLQVKQRQGRIEVTTVALPRVAALLVEPVQGEGGVYELSTDDVAQIHQVREQLNCPIISDEVQSGCGRCGSFLAGSQIGLQPDYVVLSKGLGGGVSKIGVVAIRESQYVPGFDIVQSSTFGEDDYSANIASQFLDLLMDNDQAAIKQAKERGSALKEALQGLQQRYPDVIAEIRGKGLLQGIVLQDFSQTLSHFIRTAAYQGILGYLLAGHLQVQHGIRVAPPASAGNVIRIEPSIQMTHENIQDFIAGLEKMCLAVRYQDAGYLMNHLLEEPAQHLTAARDFRPWYDSLNLQTYDDEPDAKVAFVNHLISSEWIREIDRSFDHLSDAQAEQLVMRLSFDRRVAPLPPARIRSKNGRTVDFIMHPIHITSKEIEGLLATGDLDMIRAAVDERLVAARASGCTVAGLGMFTSIVTNNCKSVNTAGIQLTSGNALTVAMAAESIHQTLIEKKINSVPVAAVVGAAGNIGSVYSSMIAEYSERLILIGSGRPGSAKRVLKTAYLVYREALQELAHQPEQATGLAAKLLPFAHDNHWLESEFVNNKTAGEQIYQWFAEQAPEQQCIQISEQLADLAQADVVVCAANASEAFIDVQFIKQQAIVCDIAIPHNLSDAALDERQDLTCLRGGIVSTPHNESLDPRVRAYLKQGQLYACMAESVVMAMEDYPHHYSYGNISKAQVKQIQQWANKHGMSLAELKQVGSM